MAASVFTICDLHTHTTFSDGRLSPDEVLQAADAKGYRVGIADHCGLADGQLRDDLQFQAYLEAISRLPVLRSAELDLGAGVGVSPELLAQCDYLIGGVHSAGGLDFFDPAAPPADGREVVDLMLGVIDRGARQHRFHVLAHPGLLPMAMRDRNRQVLDGRWSREVIELALAHGFALEISSRWELPGAGLIREAQRAGVRFSLGSDGHSRERVCQLDYSLAMVAECGLGDGQLLCPALRPTTARTVSAR